jgi:cellulose synthase/poly-beta-1,6-N-acetylglucosamine synthase-like glycosyltransferase
MIWQAAFWIAVGVIVLSYGGYGLGMALLSRWRRVPTAARYRPWEELPGVTCVMAARNEAGRIEGKLRNVTGQDYPADRIEVIVVSDGSTDGTDDIVRARASHDPRIRLLRTDRPRGKPTALNLAREHIRTDITVFMDVRQELAPGAIRELVAQLEDPSVGVASGDIRIPGDAYWRYERFVRRHESRSGSMVQVTGSLYAIRTADIPRIPTDIILDDVLVPLTVAMGGRRIVLAEEAACHDVMPRSIGNEFIRKVRTLAGVIQICHAVHGCWNPRRNPVWGRFIAHKVCRLVSPYAAVLALVSAWFAPGWGYRVILAAALGGLVGAMAPVAGARGRVFKLLQSLIALHLAALWAVPSYYLGRVSVTWARVEPDRGA